MGAVVDLQISTRKSGDVTIVDLRGRAIIGPDSDELSGYLSKLISAGALKLLLNLTGTYVSLSRQAGSLKLLRPRGRVRTVLRVIRLPKVIPTFEDEAEALASFRSRGFSAAP
jgi:hypothetical protein